MNIQTGETSPVAISSPVYATIAPAIHDRFPALVLAWALVDGLDVHGASHREALALQAHAVGRVLATRAAEGLKDDALFRAYRDFDWALGIDPTKTRPSGEALNRRVLNGKALPTINAFIDAYNAASLESGVPVGAFDAGRLTGDITLRLALAGEPFRGINEDAPKPLAGGEVVLADDARVINFYPYRDVDETKVTTDTAAALIVACGAPSVSLDIIVAAAELAASNVTQACGGRTVARGTSRTV